MYTIKYHQTPLACLPGVDIHAGHVGVQVVIVQGAATALALVPRVPGLALALEPVHLTNQRSVLCSDNQSQISIESTWSTHWPPCRHLGPGGSTHSSYWCWHLQQGRVRWRM